jgi:alkaline phosphatase
VFIPGNCPHFASEVGLFIANELQLDIPSITGELNDKANEKWLVEEVGRDRVENGVVSGSNLKARAYNHEH